MNIIITEWETVGKKTQATTVSVIQELEAECLNANEYARVVDKMYDGV
ncbi:MAG: hypothetical protein GQ583_06245 [Methyloprofundus sp.]|nr:hypothetical protein [Methyloprofundus sp.]